MKVAPITLLNLANGSKTGDMTGNLSFGAYISGPPPVVLGGMSLAQVYGYSIQAIFTGSPVGTLTLAASNIDVTAYYCTIPGTSFSVSGAGSFLWNVSWSNYLFVRMIWTATSGSGTLSGLAYTRGA